MINPAPWIYATAASLLIWLAVFAAIDQSKRCNASADICAWELR